jgi:hypothetical protein
MQQHFLTELFTDTTIRLNQILIALPLSLLLGYFIAWIYRRTTRGLSYKPSFNTVLTLVTVIVAVIMMTIASNISLSLGLVGSLSIIRFRTVLKDTTDMCFLFWAIAAGLGVGAGSYLFAALSTLFVGLVAVLLCRIVFRRLHGNDYVIVVRSVPDEDGQLAQAVGRLLDRHHVGWEIRASETDNVSGSHELVYQVAERGARANAAELLDGVRALRGVQKVSLLSSEVNQLV